jgi:hypothetical protein
VSLVFPMTFLVCSLFLPFFRTSLDRNNHLHSHFILMKESFRRHFFSHPMEDRFNSRKCAVMLTVWAKGRIREDTNSGLPTYGMREDSLGTRHSQLSQILFISVAPPPSLYCAAHVYIYTHTDCIWITADHSYTDRSGANCWLDIYRWGAGLAVTGPIRDIGQNVLQSAFGQGAAAAQLLPCFVTYRISWGGLY